MVEFKQISIPPKPKRKKIMFFSNGPNLPTGYAKVIRELTQRLNKYEEFDVSVVSENTFNAPPTTWQGMPLYGLNVPVQNNQPQHNKIAEAFAQILEQTQPDVVVLLEDSFTLANFGFHNLIKMPSKRVFYIPLDGGIIPTTGLPVIRTMDKLVAMSKFTQDELAKEGFDSEVIWHGVDLELFKPVDDDTQAKLKKKFGFKEDDYVIFNYGRNSNIRKNNQGMLWTVAKYLSEAPENHYFYFHTLDPEFQSNDLFDYCSRHLTREFGEDAVKRIRFSPYRNKNAPGDDVVAQMIQMSDLVISLSTGEGFGLLMAEAMACGKPMIANNYTTPHELLIEEKDGIGPRGGVVDPDTTFVASLNTEHAYADKEAFAEAIHEYVSLPKEHKLQMAKNGRQFAEQFLNWDILAEHWRKILNNI